MGGILKRTDTHIILKRKVSLIARLWGSLKREKYYPFWVHVWFFLSCATIISSLWDWLFRLI